MNIIINVLHKIKFKKNTCKEICREKEIYTYFIIIEMKNLLISFNIFFHLSCLLISFFSSVHSAKECKNRIEVHLYVLFGQNQHEFKNTQNLTFTQKYTNLIIIIKKTQDRIQLKHN